MFVLIGSLAVRRTRTVLVIALAIFIAGTTLGLTAFGKLKTGGFADPHSDSAQATQQLDDQFGGAGTVVLLVHATRGNVDDPAVATDHGERHRPEFHLPTGGPARDHGFSVAPGDHQDLLPEDLVQDRISAPGQSV